MGAALAALGGEMGGTISVQGMSLTVRNPGFFGLFTKPSFRILVLPLKPRSIERPEGCDKAYSIATRSSLLCHVLAGLTHWGLGASAQKSGYLRIETP